jgi:glycosyltransferase involved in cell wall biosynthesis
LCLKTLWRWTFNQADVVLCYTGVDKQRVRELGVTSRIEVVSNRIDTERFTPEGSESDLIDAEGLVVLFVGRFAEALAEYPEAEVGKLEIGEAVTFPRHVAHEEMSKVYRSGDILILPSQVEGVPRTVLEAMASGRRSS